jgi:hypothetical protein
LNQSQEARRGYNCKVNTRKREAAANTLMKRGQIKGKKRPRSGIHKGTVMQWHQEGPDSTEMFENTKGPSCEPQSSTTAHL